jgi:hypothetical protein
LQQAVQELQIGGTGESLENWQDNQAADRSHRILQREGWPDYVFAFHDADEIGPNMMVRIAKHTGLRPEDL